MKFILKLTCILIFIQSAYAQDKKTVFYQSMEWSRDGKSICFAAIVLDSGKYENGKWEIYSMNSDGTNLKKITNNNFDDMWPSFSPDNKRIVFQSNRDGNQEIYILTTGEKDVKRLTNNTTSDNYPAFSPDGQTILFISNRQGIEFLPMNEDGTTVTPVKNGINQIYKMNSDGTGTLRLSRSQSKEMNPAFSPDGKKITWYSEKGDGHDQIFVSNADGSYPVNITHDTLNNIYPGFTADGKEVIYHSSTLNHKEVCVINAGGWNRKILIHASGFFNRFSPDGKQLGYISGQWPSSEIYICRPDGTFEKMISDKTALLKLK